MNSLESLYKFFNLQLDCPDDELRRAYHQLLLVNHPDLNPDNIEEATKKTQQINEVYSKLKEYRLNPEKALFEFPTDENIGFRIVFDFGKVDKKDIAQRKSAFQMTWDAFHQRPSDIFLALRLIHTSFEAERYKEIGELLKNPIIIDASVLLLDIIDRDPAFRTLIRWADRLRSIKLPEFGVQILEDIYATGEQRDSLLDKLRSFHYGIAQGYQKDSKGKPDPHVRIRHLTRILELGFELDYIYKLLAEAYHEMGKDDDATVYLKKAYDINPKLSGAVRISRALGFLQEEKNKPKKKRKKYIYSRPEQIPHPSHIRIWAKEGNWEQILAFSDLELYSPRIIPKARSLLHQISISLGDCPDERAKEFLLKLKKSVYREVREACSSSLGRFGKSEKQIVTSDSNVADRNHFEDQFWYQLLFEEYHPNNDDHYLREITKLFNSVITSKAPDELLGLLNKLLALLEKLGIREVAVWLINLIRTEAPGTVYVSRSDREDHIGEIRISDYLTEQVNPLIRTIQQIVPKKMTELLGSTPRLKKSKSKGKSILNG